MPQYARCRSRRDAEAARQVPWAHVKGCHRKQVDDVGLGRGGLGVEAIRVPQDARCRSRRDAEAARQVPWARVKRAPQGALGTVVVVATSLELALGPPQLAGYERAEFRRGRIQRDKPRKPKLGR